MFFYPIYLRHQSLSNDYHFLSMMVFQKSKPNKSLKNTLSVFCFSMNRTPKCRWSTFNTSNLNTRRTISILFLLSVSLQPILEILHSEQVEPSYLLQYWLQPHATSISSLFCLHFWRNLISIWNLLKSGNNWKKIYINHKMSVRETLLLNQTN